MFPLKIEPYPKENNGARTILFESIPSALLAAGLI